MTTRRRFVAALTSCAGLGFASQAQPAAGGWDLSWLDRFKGKHKQVFDLGSGQLPGPRRQRPATTSSAC